MSGLTPAGLSLVALLLAIVFSCTSRVNVGILALALAWIFGLIGGAGPDAVVKTFPALLFVTLAGVTLLFAIAESNGTLERLAGAALRLARGDARLLPILLFFIACAVSTVGPGAIASVALVAPMAMAVSRRAGTPPFLTALAVTNGANAGNLSPVSAVGVIANTKMAEAGLGGHELKVWAANFAAHLVIGAAAYLLLGGLRSTGGEAPPVDAAAVRPAFSRAQWLTVALIALWIAGVVVGGVPLGLAAFAAAAVLILLRAADETDALRRMPWPAILMVTGMSALVGVVERTGGMALFTSLLARLASPSTVNGVDRLRDRRDLDVQQHVGGGAPRFPSRRPRPRARARRRRPPGHRPQHQRRRFRRGRLAPLDAGRAVRGRRRRPRGVEGPVPPAHGVGPVHDRGRRGAVPGLRGTVRAALSPRLSSP